MKLNHNLHVFSTIYWRWSFQHIHKQKQCSTPLHTPDATLSPTNFKWKENIKKQECNNILQLDGQQTISHGGCELNSGWKGEKKRSGPSWDWVAVMYEYQRWKWKYIFIYLIKTVRNKGSQSDRKLSFLSPIHLGPFLCLNSDLMYWTTLPHTFSFSSLQLLKLCGCTPWWLCDTGSFHRATASDYKDINISSLFPNICCWINRSWFDELIVFYFNPYLCTYILVIWFGFLCYISQFSISPTRKSIKTNELRYSHRYHTFLCMLVLVTVYEQEEDINHHI